MTTGEYLDSISTVSNTTALIHLQNISGGAGVDRYIPYTDITVSFQEQVLDVDFEEQNLQVIFQEPSISVDFEEQNLKVTFEPYNLDINIT